jgi:hypothetical protein
VSLRSSVACLSALAVCLALPARAPASVSLGLRTAGAPQNPRIMDAVRKTLGVEPAYWMWYADFTQNVFVPTDLDAVRARGATPMVTFEPWDAAARASKPEWSLRSIASGVMDSYFRAEALKAAAWGHPLMFRFGHEMNGDWYPWSIRAPGNSPALYVAAWRHLREVFRKAGALNVQWVWSPNVDYGGVPFEAMYPGDSYVDWVALDGYNWGTARTSGWRSLASIFGPSYDRLRRLSIKPMMIAETASSEIGGDKAAWIRTAFAQDLPRRLSAVKAVVWFDRDAELDWRISSSATALNAFRAVFAASSRGPASQAARLHPPVYAPRRQAPLASPGP